MNRPYHAADDAAAVSHFEKSRRGLSILLTAVAVIALVSIPAHASRQCLAAIESTSLIEDVFAGESVDNFGLLVEFENRANRYGARPSPTQVEVSVVEARGSVLDVRRFSESRDLDELLLSVKKKNLWFQHPFNTATSVPFFYNRVVRTIQGETSSSRSIFFVHNGRPYSFRAPTDHALGPDEPPTLNKLVVHDELGDAIHTMEQVQAVESSLGVPSRILLAREIAIVRSDAFRDGAEFRPSGYAVRELLFLENKNRYYLPAFSLASVGPRIAKTLGKKFGPLWKKNYAEALGAAKAQLLIHYGLHMDHPHGQNILLELDEKMNPTGRFVLRDLSDMSLYLPAHQALTQFLNQKGLKSTDLFRATTRSDIDLLWNRASARPLTHSGDKKIQDEVETENWDRAHEVAFVNEVARLLRIRPRDLGDDAVQAGIQLNSGRGQTWLLDYYERTAKGGS